MPTKQIYIKESDIPLFIEAEKYGDSVSRVLVEALRDFIEKKRQENNPDGFNEVIFDTGIWAPEPENVKTVKFIGKCLARVDVENKEMGTLLPLKVEWVLYKTRKEKYLIWEKSTGYEEDGEFRYPYLISKYVVLDKLPTEEEMKDFKILDDEMKDFFVQANRVPIELFIKAKEQLAQEIEWLDI